MRYQSAHELSRDVQVILKSLDTASMPFSVTSVAAPPVVRDSAWSDVRRWIYIAATAIAVVTISGGYDIGCLQSRTRATASSIPSRCSRNSTGACGR